MLPYVYGHKATIPNHNLELFWVNSKKDLGLKLNWIFLLSVVQNKNIPIFLDLSGWAQEKC